MSFQDFYNSINSIVSTTDTTVFYSSLADYFGISLGILYIILAMVTIWSFVWKGLSLWKSAGKKQPIWFIVLLIVNTVGILDILYIYVFSEIKKSDSKSKSTKKR